MKRKAIIIGAGINGLVAANYLQRAGFQVKLFERKPSVGGACARETHQFAGQSFEYPSGATVLGLMQDFIFSECSLKNKLSLFCPNHPAVVWYEHMSGPCFMYDEPDRLAAELSEKWGEKGIIADFLSDLECVRAFLINSFRDARVPNLALANRVLGSELTELWISGSARRLLDYYFTSEPMKVFCAMDVTESGPVSLDSPYSAFTIPLMASGTIFGGKWGFVKGGLWAVVEELASVNRHLGVEIITDAQVVRADSRDLTITYIEKGQQPQEQADYLIFASDPLTAATTLGDEELTQQVAEKKLLGTSGKLVLFFRQPIQWQDATGGADFESAFKFILSVSTLAEMEANTQAAAAGHDYVPGYLEIYSEGAGLRRLGQERGYDSLTVFAKNLAFGKLGADLPGVKEILKNKVLNKIINKEDLIDCILISPLDLRERFYFPQGNIDHIELSDAQTYFARTFSNRPDELFYQFGSHEKIMYCAAGAYPCGSIAGTPGYMCANELTRQNSPVLSGAEN